MKSSTLLTNYLLEEFGLDFNQINVKPKYFFNTVKTDIGRVRVWTG